MKTILILLFLGIAIFFPVQNSGMRPSQTVGQTSQLTPEQLETIEVRQAERFRFEGNLAEAQRHFEKALALNPSSKSAPEFIAQIITAQYKPGGRDEANIAKGHEAIAAYKRILARDPQDEGSYRAVASLYRSLEEDELFRGWVFQRAVDPAFSADNRAEAFVALGDHYWACSLKITEWPTNKTATVLKSRATMTRYVKPKDLAMFEKARQCATDGLGMIDRAIVLTLDNTTAWRYKNNLLVELSKLAEMDNNLRLKTDYDRQSRAARSTLKKIIKRYKNNPPNKA